ncbi:Organic cation transporter protein [Gryllus bimaculatus]|nr:Organic cation transporter protein [Gryllus bimaculatus]
MMGKVIIWCEWCRVPECEDNGTEFLPDWVEWAAPKEERGGEMVPSRCHRYVPVTNTSDTCWIDGFTNVTERCNDWVYKTSEITIVREWNVTCEENKWKLTVAGMLVYTGVLLSKPFAGYVSDRFGRKTMLLAGLALAGSAGALRGLSQSFLMFQICNILEGIFGGGIYSAAFVMGLELMGPKKRVLGGAIMSSYNAFGEIAMGAIAWGLQSWRLIHAVIYGPAVLFIFYIWLLPESVRWLLAKGKKDKAEKIMLKAAKMNGVPAPTDMFKSLSSLEKLNTEPEPSPLPEKGVMGQAIRSRILMLRLIMLSFTWASISFVFSGLTFNATSLAGNKYVNFMLAGLIEMPGHLLTYFGMDRLGRKGTLAGSLSASSLCCFLFIAVPPDIVWLGIGLYLLGKFAITTSYDVMYMYAAELFPTKLRHSMISACSMLGGIGAIAAPVSPLLNTYFQGLHLILFGGFTLASAIITLFLPETRGVKLPDTVEEAEQLGTRNYANRDYQMEERLE